MSDARVLVVFYSLSGHAKKIGEAIANALGADVEQIYDKVNRHGFFGFMRSGFEGTMGRLTALQETEKDPAAYDLVIVGGPTWAGSLSSPVRTYLTHKRGQFKAVAFFRTCQDPKNKKIFPQMENACGMKPVAVLNISEADMAAGEDAAKVERFVAEISNALA